VLGLDPATGGMERYIGLEGRIDPGQKKVGYAHCQRPALLALPQRQVATGSLCG
jgi:hypothetical protein